MISVLHAICREIVSDALNDGMTLPTPYNTLGMDTLLNDLKDPETLSDNVLAWLIDMPGKGLEGPLELRMHKATQPIVREFGLYHLGWCAITARRRPQ